MPPSIALEALNPDHTLELYRLTEANREHLREWLPWLDSIRSSRDTRAFIDATMAESAAHGAPHFAIRSDGRLCGVAGFHALDTQNRTGSLGYWLDRQHGGRGIITAAVAELVQLGFGECRLNRIEISCAVGNPRSRAIPERLGFTLEGVLRQCEWLYSHYVDHAVYAMLADDPQRHLIDSFRRTTCLPRS
ncbi:GNAT family N-acetyltransferase [Marinobacter sp. CA1]|uniref:GNAT family N-acetyltransferase n=1 Tax=Marinobacter sp. CA1 TaxID=2817656 RepID=UPI001D063DAE|nr:GNAT family N-acetyltransferase [Marinobacter sp. CA1]UDL03585.1 GNAT family N-acetyltransferase [Marinobacter sp. CA1]